MKYYLILIRRNPFEVMSKLFNLVKEKFKMKSVDAKKVIIYSLGKAGTSSIYEALRYNRNVDVKHIHYLSNMPSEINQWRILEEKRAMKAKMWIEDGDVLIISLIRDAFSRSVSSVIQNYELYHENTYLSKAIVENAKSVSLNWWDDEFLKSMDWNIYDHSFDKKNGFSQYPLGNNNKLLVIKSTFLSSAGFQKLNKELNLELKDKRVNISRNKGAAIKHKHILENFKFSESDFDFISESKFMKHFYTSEEIYELKQRWV